MQYLIWKVSLMLITSCSQKNGSYLTWQKTHLKSTHFWSIFFSVQKIVNIQGLLYLFYNSCKQMQASWTYLIWDLFDVWISISLMGAAVAPSGLSRLLSLVVESISSVTSWPCPPSEDPHCFSTKTRRLNQRNCSSEETKWRSQCWNFRNQRCQYCLSSPWLSQQQPQHCQDSLLCKVKRKVIYLR